VTAKLYEAAGTLAFYLGRTADAKERFAAASATFAATEAWAGYARVLGAQAIVARAEGHYAHARRLYHQALGLQRARGDLTMVAKTLYDLGYLEFRTGETMRAATYFEESLDCLHRSSVEERLDCLQHSSGLDGEIAKVGLGLGMVRLESSDLDQAEQLIAASLATFRRLDEPARQAEAELCLGHVRRRQGDHQAARLLYLACLDRRLQIGKRTSIPQVLSALAAAEKALQRPERAVILLAAAGALRSRLGMIASPSETDAEATLGRRLRAQLGEEAYQSGWARGSAMTSAAAAALARGDDRDRGQDQPSAAFRPSSLTSRSRAAAGSAQRPQ
jgi:tetratricopeptide (TPR) repeat protein